MAAKLATEVDKATCARRKCVVEPAFGQIKQARGFRRISFRTVTATAALTAPGAAAAAATASGTAT